MMKSNSRFVNEDILMSKILQNHVPDGRCVDSDYLLCVVKKILCEIKTPHMVKTPNSEEVCSGNQHEIGKADAQQEQWQLAHQVSIEILFCSYKYRSSHATTLTVLELLGNYSWGGKVVLVLSAFAKCYGDFWLIGSLCQTDGLALSLAMLKGLVRVFRATELLWHWLKALRCLAEKMVDIAKLVIEFEAIPMQYMTLDDSALAEIKPSIQIACYWMIRSSLSCASQITSMVAMNFKDLTCQTWELGSLAYKINHVHAHLQKQLDDFLLHMGSTRGLSVTSLQEQTFQQ